MTSRAQTVLAFDFGLKHIGTATGQSITGTANPLTTLKAKAGTPQWPEVVALVREWQPQRLLVGLPLNMDGTESEMSELARAFAARLAGECDLPVSMVDERLTSFTAKQEAPQDLNLQHQLAAVQIVQGYFNET